MCCGILLQPHYYHKSSSFAKMKIKEKRDREIDELIKTTLI